MFDPSYQRTTVLDLLNVQYFIHDMVWVELCVKEVNYFYSCKRGKVLHPLHDVSSILFEKETHYPTHVGNIFGELDAMTYWQAKWRYDVQNMTCRPNLHKMAKPVPENCVPSK